MQSPRSVRVTISRDVLLITRDLSWKIFSKARGRDDVIIDFAIMRVVEFVFDDVRKAEPRIDVNNVFRVLSNRSVGFQTILRRWNLQLESCALYIYLPRFIFGQKVHPLGPLSEHFNLATAPGIEIDVAVKDREGVAVFQFPRRHFVELWFLERLLHGMNQFEMPKRRQHPVLPGGRVRFEFQLIGEPAPDAHLPKIVFVEIRAVTNARGFRLLKKDSQHVVFPHRRAAALDNPYAKRFGVGPRAVELSFQQTQLLFLID